MIRPGTEKFDENGNLLYYEMDNGEFRIFRYDERGRLIYYRENYREISRFKFYEEWREYAGFEEFAHLQDCQGNDRYIDRLQNDATQEQFEEARFEAVNNPDRFKFEMIEL